MPSARLGPTRSPASQILNHSTSFRSALVQSLPQAAEPHGHWADRMQPVPVDSGDILACPDGYVRRWRQAWTVARQVFGVHREDWFDARPLALDHPRLAELLIGRLVGIVAKKRAIS